ncbi:MAG: hypothetical protein WBG11_04275 [Methylocella sp.]
MRTIGECLPWNDERLRIDLIVERYRASRKYATKIREEERRDAKTTSSLEDRG